tara:strand:+ start:167 stop:835 length:669 start_codon:yes stop_codon:yes gene_type:complete
MVITNIKKNLHQIWHNGNIPDEYYRHQQSLIKHHKNWNYKLWNLNEIRNLIKDNYSFYLDTYDKLKFDIQKIDVGKFFILDYYGGLYADIDIFFYKNITPLIKNNAILFFENTNDKNKIICNSIFYNNNSSFFNKICKQIKILNKLKNNKHDNDIETVLKSNGPKFLTDFYKINNFKPIDVNILNHIHFEFYDNIRDYKKEDFIYGIHEYANSWFEKNKVLI